MMRCTAPWVHHHGRSLMKAYNAAYWQTDRRAACARGRGRWLPYLTGTRVQGPGNGWKCGKRLHQKLQVMRRREKLSDVVASLFVWLVCPPGWKDARVRSGQDGGSRYITGGLAAPHQQTRPAPPPHITSPCSSSSWWVPSTQIHDYKYISLIFLLWTTYIVSFTSTFLKKSFIYFSKIFTSYKNIFQNLF